MRVILVLCAALVASDGVLSVTTPARFHDLFREACIAAFEKKDGQYIIQGCSEVWNIFSKAFAFKDLINPEEDFNAMQVTPLPIY